MNAIRIDSPSWIRTAILSDIGIAAYSILESLMLSKHQATRWYAGSVCGPLIRPMPSKQAPIPNLDFFRACAVLFVLVDHTLDKLGVKTVFGTEIQWLGRTGVLFFFVHTCCVLMMSLERHKGRHYFLNFYLRRLFRIYPLGIVAVLLAMIPPYASALTHKEWISNLLLIQNLTFSQSALGPLWSLPIEVQMYLFLPFVFLLARAPKTIWPILGLFAISIPIALWETHHLARASVLYYVPDFLPGTLAYWIYRHYNPILPNWTLPLTICVVTTAFMADPNWTFSAWFACLTLGFLVPLTRQIQNRRVNWVAFHIAKYSFGIYLGHSLLLRWIPMSWAVLPVYLICVAAVSVASFHFVEEPMIRFGQRLTADPVPSGIEERVGK